MIDTNKLKKIKESNKTHHIYIEGEYLYMIRYGDYKNEIEKTQRLQEKGVNFAGPINQIKIDENQVVVEEYLAKGTSFEKMKDEYKFHSSLDFAKTLEEYELFFSTYLEEIRLRAEANQKMYDKLFNDIIEMNKENLTVDTRSLGNLFFDKTVGFSIIDAYPGNNIPDIKQLFRMIIGNIPSLICIDNNQEISNGVPQKYFDNFLTYISMIKNKFIMAMQRTKVNIDYNNLQVNTNVVTDDIINKLIEMEKESGIRVHI